MTVLTPNVKTKSQQKKYLSKLGLTFHPNINASSKFRVMFDNSEIYEHHLDQDVPVITTPFSTGHEPETTILRLVNLGTYFAGVTATNFFVRPHSYHLFTSKYTRHDYAEFKQDHNQRQTERKLAGNAVIFNHSNVFCTSNLNVCYDTYGKIIVQPVDFVRSNPSGKKGIVMHYELHDSYCTASQNFQLKENLKIIREIMSGDEDRLLADIFTGEQVEQVALPIKIKGQANIFDLHHIKVTNGKSADKIGVDPAKILRTFDLTKTENKHHIAELMKCVCLSKNTHALVHAVANSGLSDYKKKHRPWVLQSAANFKKFCSKHKLSLADYNNFIADLG